MATDAGEWAAALTWEQLTFVHCTLRTLTDSRLRVKLVACTPAVAHSAPVRTSLPEPTARVGRIRLLALACAQLSALLGEPDP